MTTDTTTIDHTAKLRAELARLDREIARRENRSRACKTNWTISKSSVLTCSTS
jgi:ribosome-interacting GTPase 1